MTPNMCDGCQRGLPIEGSRHVDDDARNPFDRRLTCTRDRYVERRLTDLCDECDAPMADHVLGCPQLRKRRTGDGVIVIEGSGTCRCGEPTGRRLFGAFVCERCVPVRRGAEGVFGAGHRPVRR